MELKETFVSRQEIFHGRIVDLRVDTVRLPNGHLTTREVIDHPGGVAVVAIDENDNVLTVKQYRYAFQTVLEEIPAGKLERGEDLIKLFTVSAFSFQLILAISLFNILA